MTAAEATWLAERIGRDGRMTPNERALLMFLKTESPSIDPALRALVEKAAVAGLSRIGGREAGPMPASLWRDAVANAS